MGQFGRYVEIQPEDILIEVRSLALGRLGQVDMRFINGETHFIKRFNNVGVWRLTLSDDYWLRDELAKPGRGLIVTLYDTVYLSGPMTDFNRKRTTDDPVGTTIFNGVDEMVYLSDARAYPTPSTDNVGQQVLAYDDRSGKAETVLKQYFDANVGTGAPAARQMRPMRSAPDLGRGADVKASARFDVLGPFMSDLAISGGGLGFDITQIDDQMVYEVYIPRDRTRLVRMDIDNDLLSEVESGIGAPGLTRMIVGGSGEDDLRVFVEVTDPDALAAEEAWGRRIESFKDERSTEEEDKLYQSGLVDVQENGRTNVSLKVTPSDNDTMQFGKDWFIGDKVSVVVDEEELTSIVTEAILAIDISGVKIGATVGDPTGYDYEAVQQRMVSNHERRLQALERLL